MAKDMNPFGFLPARKRDGQPNSEGYGQIVQPVSNSAVGMVSLIPTTIFAGDMIFVDATGTISPAVRASLKITGVFQGCQYVQNGEPKFSRYYPGGISASDVKLHVITDPTQTYYAQVDAAVTDGAMIKYLNYTVSNSAGSTTTGQSKQNIKGTAVAVDASIGAHVKIIGRKDYDGDSVYGNVSAGDAYPIVECYVVASRYVGIHSGVTLG
mgnify:FL=1